MENKQVNTGPNTTPVMRSFKDNKGSSPMKAVGIFVILLILGVFTGYKLSKNATSPTGTKTSILNVGGPAKGKVFGSNDTKTFKDTAEGDLKEGGIDGEGQYHLERPGGESQNVYMTSGTVDLSKFVGKKIKVWGQTQTAQKAGWLMDVGRVEVL
jgi:hypothetical protein